MTFRRLVGKTVLINIDTVRRAIQGDSLKGLIHRDLPYDILFSLSEPYLQRQKA